MRWIVLFLFATMAFALPKVEFKNSCVPLEKFNDTQKEVLLRSYLAGYQFGFGYTLAAIAWKESCAGEYKMNFQDPSAGIFHAYIPGVIKRYPKLKQNGFTQNMVGAMLVEDDKFAAQIAISEGYSWQKNLQSNIQAEKYYADIAKKVKQLQEYFASNELDETALKIPQEKLQNIEYYANLETQKEKEPLLLPIYQIGTEFAAPLKKNKTILKEFELMEDY